MTKISKEKLKDVKTGKLEELVMKRLRTVVDPELGVNIVDLGLVYGVKVNKSKSPSTSLRMNKSKRRDEVTVTVKMTLTTPGCPLAPLIHKLVEDAVVGIRGVEEVKLQLVWDPPWSMERVSEEVKLQMGWI